MSRMRGSWPARVASMAVASAALVACGDLTSLPPPTVTTDDPTAAVTPPRPAAPQTLPADLASLFEPRATKPTNRAGTGRAVLYDDSWVVEEGQWWLGAFPEQDESEGPSYHRLLESVGDTSVVITEPGFYGRYRVRIELDQNAPDIPRWCEDVAEASLRVDPGSDSDGPVMGSFETFSEELPLEPGWYRVRYCTEKQDVAARQDEFDESGEYTLYAGRHLFQLWKAPQTPDVTIRAGSAFARDPARTGADG